MKRLLLTLLLTGCYSGPPAPPAPPSPKSNDHRVVHCGDGTYRIQYYFDTPSWHNFCANYGTAEEAILAMRRMDAKPAVIDPDKIAEAERAPLTNQSPQQKKEVGQLSLTGSSFDLKAGLQTPLNIVFSGSEGLSVTLDTQTGEVTHGNMTPPQSAKVFWEAVTQCFPEIRRAIKEAKE